MNSSTNIDWIDKSLYPFESHYLQLPNGRMHYIDEGKGDVLLFIHGTPTWSFLYRDYINAFSKNYRCIAIDHLGFGLSEKPENAAATPQWHAQNLVDFIKQLDLNNSTLIVHDFGGPIGLASGIELADRIKQVVVFNTWLWKTKTDEAALKVDKILNGVVGKFLYLCLNFSPRVLLKKGFADKKKLTKRIHQHYLKPFPNKKSRQFLLKLGQALVGSSDWYQEQFEQLDRLEKKPFLFLWGTKDEFITPTYLQRWKERLPKAEVHTFDCGHYVQEEASVATIKAIQSFLS